MTQKQGLEGVVAARTVLSEVDGAKGRLLLRGEPVEQASRRSVAANAAALWRDLSPVATDGEPDAVQAALGAARVTAFEQLPPLAGDGPPLDRMAAALASLATPTGVEPHHLAVGALPVILAALIRTERGQPPVAPDPAASVATDLLTMTGGGDAARADALRTYLVTVSDHGLNASTFTARVIASTGAGTIPALTGALCALGGPLHGGAPGPVLDMLDAAGDDPATIRAWLEQRLAAGERLMGFGHRVYRARDPRADVLAEATRQLAATDDTPRLASARALETLALEALAKHKPGRELRTNVEFYTAVLLEALGFDRRYFTAVFAVGRAVGWAAHVFEQRAVGRLIRPRAEYVGPRPAAG